MLLFDAQPADFDFFYETRKACFESYVVAKYGTWDDFVQRTEAELEFAPAHTQIVVVDGARIGYLVVKREVDHWFIDELALTERNRGFGTQLVRALMRDARAAGVPLRLSVLESNPAQRLYARLGFRVTRIESPRVKMEWS